METLDQMMRSYHCGHVSFDDLAKWHWEDKREKMILERALFNVLGDSPMEMLMHLKLSEEELIESGVITELEEEEEEDNV